jgi:type II secretory pathway pseudopilin PulG
MNLRKGFMLLEIILSLAIGSILSVILLQSVGSMGKTFQKVVAVSSLERRFTLIQQQFERDFSGAMSPEIALEDEQRRKTEDEAEQKTESEDKEKDDKKPEAKTNTKKEKPQKKKIPHAFFSKNSEAGNCTQLTCVTTNPIAIYGEAIPRLVRVVYSLDADPEHEGLFLLARQQSDILDFKDFSPDAAKPIRKYTIADGIQSWKVDYLVPKPPEDDTSTTREEAEKKKKEEEKKKDKRELIPLSEWKHFETPEEEKKSKRPPYPPFIHVTLSLIDEQQRPSTFELWYAPLYDGDKLYLVEGISTLPDTSSGYHDRFMEHKSRQQQLSHLSGGKR